MTDRPTADEVREAVEGLQRLLDTCTTLNGKPVRPDSAYRQDLDTLVRAATIPPEVAEAWERYTDQRPNCR